MYSLPLSVRQLELLHRCANIAVDFMTAIGRHDNHNEKDK
jgi:hypothetical protein